MGQLLRRHAQLTGRSCIAAHSSTASTSASVYTAFRVRVRGSPRNAARISIQTWRSMPLLLW